MKEDLLLMDKYKNHVLVAGFAQLPKGTPAFEMQKSIGCILIVNQDTAVIEKATFTFIKDLTNDFISSLLIGYSLVDDIDEILLNMEKKFLVPPQKAVAQSILSARNRYIENALLEK